MAFRSCGSGLYVLEAMHGEEALRMVHGREQEIALLITDVVIAAEERQGVGRLFTSAASSIEVLYISGIRRYHRCIMGCWSRGSHF